METNRPATTSGNQKHYARSMQFVLDWSSSISPEEQLLQQMLIFQEAGLLHHRHQLPTVRALALQLNVPPPVVTAAVQRWEIQGIKRLLLPVVRQARQEGYTQEQLVKVLDELWQSPS
jgi:DNA-binding transcriptional MocR family regulator